MKLWANTLWLFTALVFLCGCQGGNSGSTSGSAPGSPPSAPGIQVIDPSAMPAGVSSFQLTVVGTGFESSSVVRWNGTDVPTMSNGSINGLFAQIPASDLATAGTAAVTVFNPGPHGGSSNALTFTVTAGGDDPQSIAVDPAGRFAYVMDAGSGDSGGYVSMYTINPTTGTLTSIGAPVSTNGFGTDMGSGVNAGSVAVDPTGKFVYVTNAGNIWYYGDGADGTVAVYAINSATGALSSTGTLNGNCPGLCIPSSMVVDPLGKLAYVANGGGGFPFNVAMYDIDNTSGALTSIGTIASGAAPISLAVDPADKFVYVADWTGSNTDGSVSMYAIDATTGSLTSIGTIATGEYPTWVAIDPSAKFVYVANSGSNDVSMYTIDATTGALAFTGSVASGVAPVSVAVDPTGKFAYVANWTTYNANGSVSMYTIDATTGSLTPIGTIATEISPNSIVVHPSGKFVYVVNSGSNSVSIFSIDSATGVLTLVGTVGT
jgi:YVTN family beta-propeller protein